MATKRTKSPGSILGQSRQFWENGAKQFKWPVDYEKLEILIPNTDWQEAQENGMVSYFRSQGWHVQSVIGEVEYNNPYIAPVTNGKPMFWQKPEEKKQELESPYKLGQVFEIVSTGCHLKLTRIESQKVHLHYENRNSPDLISSIENLRKVLRMGVWKELF